MSVGILTTAARFSQAGCLEPVGLKESRSRPSDQLREAFTGGHGRSPYLNRLPPGVSALPEQIHAHCPRSMTQVNAPGSRKAKYG